MRYTWFLSLVVVVTIAAAALGVQYDFSVHLKVVDCNGEPLPQFDVKVHAGDGGFASWKHGINGKVLLRSKDNDFPIFGHASRYQIIIRANGYASTMLEMDRPESDIKRTVMLIKGRPVDLVIKTYDGKAIPDSLVPMVIFSDLRSEVWFSFRTLNGRRKHNFNWDFIPLTKTGPGRYSFLATDDFPEIYVFVDEPGFLRGFRAGPFGEKEMADDKIEVRLPRPAELTISVESPEGSFDKLPYGKWGLYVHGRSLEVENQGQALHTLAEVKSDEPKQWSDKEYFAPGGYWLAFSTGPSDDSSEFESGQPNPAYYSDMKKYSLVAGQVEKVVFTYTAYDENAYKGDYSATALVRWQNGKYATGLPYVLYYNDKHFGAINIKEGTISEDGQIKLIGLAGGTNPPRFTLEIGEGRLGRHFIQLDGEQKHRVLEYNIAPKEGDIAPDISLLEVFSGKKVKLSDYKGKVIFIEFWATWCGPCQSPLAKLCEIVSRREKDWRDKVEVWAISIDTQKENVQEHLRERGWLAVRHLWCDGSKRGWKSNQAQAYGITGVPTALLIDQSGCIVWRGHPRKVNIEEKIDQLLKIGEER